MIDTILQVGGLVVLMICTGAALSITIDLLWPEPRRRRARPRKKPATARAGRR
jgi:hypothetical protein